MPPDYKYFTGMEVRDDMESRATVENWCGVAKYIVAS